MEQLRRFGSDVNRKHEVSFWLYFPNEESAQHTARRGETCGLKAEVSPPRKGCGGLCLFSYPHVPDEVLLDGISQFCTDIAAELQSNFHMIQKRAQHAKLVQYSMHTRESGAQ